MSRLAAGVNPGFIFSHTLNLDYSTYLGRRVIDYGRGISVGLDGRACVIGITSSSDFPTRNPYQARYGGGSFDVFVSRLTLIASPTPSMTPEMRSGSSVTHPDSGRLEGLPGLISALQTIFR